MLSILEIYKPILLIILSVSLIGCSNTQATVTPDYFATEMEMTATEILAEMIEPSNLIKEQTLMNFVKNTVASSSYDESQRYLDDYVTSLKIVVEDGNILFIVSTEFPGEELDLQEEKIMWDVFYDLFVSAVVNATNESEEFVWTVKTIGTTFEFQNQEWVDIYMTKEDVVLFMNQPDNWADFVTVQTSRDGN